MPAFDDNALRAIIDLRDAYEATLEVWRALDQHEGSMFWRNRGERQYLVHRLANRDERSIGPRSPETEQIHETFRARKHDIKQTIAATTPDLRRAAAVYVAMGLPVVDSWSAKLAQHLDRAGLLGGTVMVIGTNAMPAYQIEAQQRTGQRMHATRDFDLAWTSNVDRGDFVLWPTLREFAPDLSINVERPFQARTQARREIELSTAPSVMKAAAHEPFQTIAMPEQEWLLLGQPLRHVVTGLDRTPTAISVPDPRYFALHKAWLAQKPERDPLKKPKDRSQAQRVWAWLQHDMPRFTLDEEFRSSVPVVLQQTMAQLDEHAARGVR